MRETTEREDRRNTDRRDFIVGAAGSLLATTTCSRTTLAEYRDCRPVIEPYAPPPPVEYVRVGSGGRKLAYCQYGAENGPAVIYLHGFPSCRYEAQVFHWPAKRLNCRVIAPDRPGMGRSSFAPRRTIASWADDVAALVDALEVRDVSIVGVSTGAPYTLACLLRLSGVAGVSVPKNARLRSAALVSALTPLDAIGVDQGLGAKLLSSVHRRPRLAAFGFRRAERLIRRRPSRGIANQTARMANPDRRLAAHPTSQRVLSEVYLETVCRGVDGLIRDAALASCPWHLPLDQLHVLQQPLYLWQGCCDLNVPPASARYYQQLLQVPETRVRMVTDGGHLTVSTYCAEQILRDLLT